MFVILLYIIAFILTEKRHLIGDSWKDMKTEIPQVVNFKQSEEIEEGFEDFVLWNRVLISGIKKWTWTKKFYHLQ